jgi:hypothetical protein
VARSVGAARWRRWALLALALLSLSCQAAQGDRHGGDPAGPQEPGLTLALTPRPAQGDVLVEVRVTGPPAAAVRELHVSRAWADTKGAEAIEAIEVRDDRGEIPRGEPLDGEAERVFPLFRPPAGELLVRYAARGTGSRLGLRIGTDRMTGVGHGFLLLPRIEAPVPARVVWHLEALDPGARGASSLGEGDEAAPATSSALAHAVYAAGALASARAGEQRLHALGASSLNPRDLLSWAGRVRTVASARLHPDAGAAAEPLSIFLIGEPGLGQDHDGAFLDRSIGLWFDQERFFDPQLRITLAHELLHRHIGGAIRVVEEAGEPAGWFAEGFTVHYARLLLLEAGMIAPADFAEDLERMEPPGPGGRPAPAGGPRAAQREVYRLGSRYAALLDRELRRASKGARSLDDFVAALRGSGPQPLKIPDFRAAVARELGEEGAAAFDRLILRREAEIELPKDAFGPCFRRVEKLRRVFDLGFDPASLGGAGGVILGVQRGSAGYRAGLRDGALVLKVRRLPRPEDGPDAQVDLTLADPRGGRRVRYKPAALRGVARWEARPCR